MAWKNSGAFKEWKDRRSQRYAERGLGLEDEVETLLTKMRDAGEIDSFSRHARNSPEDCDGRDFTIVQSDKDASFGVTISIRSWNEARLIHPDVPQFCFPPGTKPETMEKRILNLLN